MIPAHTEAAPPGALLGGSCADLIAAERIVAATLHAATGVHKQCAACGPPMRLTVSADLVQCADRFVCGLPSDAAIRGAEAGLRAALAAPPQPAEVALIVAALLDGIGQRLSTVTAAYVTALTGVLGPDSVGDDLDLRKTFPMSMLVVVLAASHILRTTKFAPRPVELLDAARRVHARAERVADELHDYAEMREAAEDIVLRYADPETYQRLEPMLTPCEEVVPFN
jgi:hypothetical protein